MTSKYEPLTIEGHDALVEHLPEIFRRINEADLGRLVIINPILALEDVGVTLTPDLRSHLRRTVGFGAPRVRKIAGLRRDLKAQLRKYEGAALPESPRERAALIFDILKVAPRGERPEALTVEALRPYDHPLIQSLLDLGRLERGAITFEAKEAYERYRAQPMAHHPWLKSLRFREE